jgi:TonB-dependent receptor
MKSIKQCTYPFIVAGILLIPNQNTQAQTLSGEIGGVISNKVTRQYLEGAAVQIVELNRTTLTDQFGRYRFDDVPYGEYMLLASYTGLDSLRQSANVKAPGMTKHDFDLTAQAYQLETYSVVGEREGNAASITRQKNAPNIKNVIALDAMGILPNDNVAELLVRLPGVAGEMDDSGEILTVQLRGAANTQSSVMIDGVRMPSNGGFQRNFQLNKMPGALFNEIDVTKASTPDMDADSIGGAVNLKTRSPLAMKEKYRVSYRIGGRWSPPFYDHVPFAREDPINLQASVNFQGKFSLFSDEPNIGLGLNSFYSFLTRPSRFTRYAYNTGITTPHFTPTLVTHDTNSPREQKSFSLKLDYQLSDRTKFFINLLYNDAYNTFNQRHLAQAITGSSLVTFNSSGAPTGTGTIYPGYTNTFVRVRGTTASVFTITESANRYRDNQRQAHFGAEHSLNRIKIDYEANYSLSKTKANDGADGGIFSQRVRNVGWTLDSSTPEEPIFTQTEGPSIYNIASYDNGNITWRNNHSLARILTGSANATYQASASIPLKIKAGVRFRRETADADVDSRLWTYLGTDGIIGNADDNLAKFVDPTIRASQWSGANALPFPGVAKVMRDIAMNPTHWRIDPYRTETQRLMGERSLSEQVSAAYLQAQGAIGRLRALGGVRVERTDVDGTGFVQSKTLTTTAQRTADPIGSARADWNNLREISGGYTNTFPSIHLSYNLKPNLVARTSWSTGIARPAMGNLVPRETANNTAQTLRINNPSLLPQYSDNFDLSIEYYFEPVGLLSLSAFRKSLSDYIIDREAGIVGTGTDNGYNGEYAGYSLITQANSGTARIEGIEFAYQQQLTFLPKPLKGLGVNASYTLLQTRGDYGDAVTTSTDQVPGFIPRTANFSLSYKYRRLSARYMLNYTSDYFVAFNDEPSLLRYKYSRVSQNASTTFNLRRGIDLYCNLENLSNAPVKYYYYSPDRPERTIFTGTFITFGITGSF